MAHFEAVRHPLKLVANFKQNAPLIRIPCIAYFLVVLIDSRDLDFDNCTLPEVIGFLHKMSREPDTSTVNLAFCNTLRSVTVITTAIPLLVVIIADDQTMITFDHGSARFSPR